MYDPSFDNSQTQTCQNVTNTYQSNSCFCNRCERTRTFSKLLNHLTIASKTIDYEERITAAVTRICKVCAAVDFHRTYIGFRIILG